MTGLRCYLIDQAARLEAVASSQTEAKLLRATVWLEMRPDAQANRRISELIALHYLLLSGHPEVQPQQGLAERYRRRAWTWADHAEMDSRMSRMLLEGGRVDA